MLMHGAPLHRHAIPNGGDRALEPRTAIDDESRAPPLEQEGRRDGLTERWVADHLRMTKASKKQKRTRHS